MGFKQSTTSDNNSLSIAKTQSVLSKLTIPFTPKKRNLAEYYIRIKEPHRQYSPGDRVEGSVIVSVTRPFRVVHLVICLHGFVKVFNNDKVPGQSVYCDRGPLSGGIGKRGSEYFGEGFASLFENEVALCGEGRLEVGSFEFQFDLELPSTGLPSSLNFERGTISYMITSTITRPTTISPTSTCCSRIKLVEAIDIAPIPRPKPRTISVETLSKRSANKRGSRKDIISFTAGKNPTSSNFSTRCSTNRSDHVVGHNSNQPPKSPVPSELSSASATSSCASSHLIGSTQGPVNISPRSEDWNSTDSLHDQMVTATIELMQGGCLPGDKLPIQILVNHNKPVKRLQGIIITMYREGHVDTHPAIPLGPSRPGKKRQYEDYYPRSRTGLGGLSLSSAGSSSGFRKDLSQKVVPLIIDPRSLCALIKTSIQIPEDLFPTISSVPGDMVTFKYYMEVVIDLRGKLGGQDRFLPRLNMTSGDSKYDFNEYISKQIGFDGVTLPSISPMVFLNTEDIRREKGVVCCLFHVVVGTRDSERKRTRQVDKQQTFDIVSSEPSKTYDSSGINEFSNEPHSMQPIRDITKGPNHQNGLEGFDGNINAVYNNDDAFSQNIPPPDTEESLDEKSQIRRAELRLLPSAPPEVNDHLSLNIPYMHPSAPELYENERYIGLYRHNRPDASFSEELPTSSLETVIPNNDNHNDHCSFHANEDFTSTSELQEDKQELERRRLQMYASSPDDDQDSNVPCSNDDTRRAIEPTAPFLGKEYNLHHHDPDESHLLSLQTNHLERNNENLPLYEK